MAAPPIRDDLANNPTNAEFKLAIGELWDYTTSLLGNEATVALDSEKKLARESLGVGSFGFKNRFINPEFSVAQQYGASSVTVTAGAGNKYVIDRWYASAAGANITAQRISGIREREYSFRLTGSSGNTAVIFGHRIEGVNCFDLTNNNVTVSFNSKVSTAKTLAWTAYYANTKDVFSSKTVIATGSINVTTSIDSYNFTFNAGANAGNGIAIEFSIGALGTAETIDFDELQIEKSAIKTEFEFRPYSIELNMCQRYYEIMHVGFSNGAISAIGQTLGGIFAFSAVKRVAPSVALVAGTDGQIAFPAGVAIYSVITNYYALGFKTATAGNSNANWYQSISLSAEL